ncbi:MAG: molecular chaperone HtpG [Ignavibacteria bacterium GWB2_35_6b]|nr:MAG: molecular chaperone HtpG [Ignavibacteria bacterium GWB2_35_6b]
MSTATQYEFKAEIKQLLNILVHSLYTNKEIFLRELISNASDALDKLRFESTRGTKIADSNLPLEIKLSFNKDKKIITLSDTGIGMSKEEIIKNIGTIAKSGSEEFIKKLSENKQDANNIIGKFGVGFYSVFMVADKVAIKSKSFNKDEKPIRWVSDGLGSYELEELDEKLERGTQIEIHLKDEEIDFADKWKLEQIVKKHSNFINFPIKIDNEQINKVTALWREPKSQVKKEQYDDFYKFLSYDNEEPLDVIHLSVDAPIQFHSLMFIPKKTFDLFGMNRDNYGLDLYVRRVLIQHQNKDLLPEFLSFVKGIVDSEDLPLNISRETLQENVIFNKISHSVTSQVLSFLSKMAEKEKDKYAEFWKEHGKVFKLGYSDYANRDKYAELLRFNSSVSKDAKEIISFAEYVERLKKDQKEIYYKLGPSREAIDQDPHLEIFKSKGLEVLYLMDPIDEFALSSVMKYKDYELKSVDQVDLSTLDKFETVEDKNEKKEELTKDDKKHLDSLFAKMKEILGDKVTEVKISKRLKGSPACLVNPNTGMSASMQKIMNIVNKDNSIPAHILEINEEHKLIRNLLKVFKQNSNDEYIKNVTEQLYESSLLMEGYLADPHKLVNRINQMLAESSDWYTSIKKL